MDSLSTRRRLFREQNGKCHYCKVKMEVKEMTPYTRPISITCTIDHIKPKALGGGNYPSNLVGACLTCNNIRGTIPYEAFKWFVSRYGRGITPTQAFRHLDKKSPDYLDNLSTWQDLTQSGRQRVLARYDELVRMETMDTLAPTEANASIVAWEPKWKERRRYLTIARRNIKQMVDAVPYYRKNDIWLKYLKEEKNHASHDRP